MPGIPRRNRVLSVLLLIAASACGKARDSSTAEPTGPLSDADDTGTSVGDGSDMPSDSMSVGDEVPGGELPVMPSVVCNAGAVAGDITANTQAAINRLAGCEIIHGSLTIQFPAPTLDLQPLASLRVIEGKLDVRPAGSDSGNPLEVRLRSLRGLENLSSVSSLIIVSVDSGLDPLSQLSGDVADVILDNVAGVRDLSALGGIRITSMLSMNVMPDLETLEGVSLAPQLQTLSIWAAPRLTTLAGLDGLVGLVGLDLLDVAALNRLSLPASLVSLSGVDISGAPELTTLAELSRFAGIKVLRVSHSPRLADLGGNDGSTGSSLEFLMVVSCPALSEIAPVGGFAALREVYIHDCDGITELDRLGESAAIQFLHVFDNPSLTRLPVFERGPAQMTQIRIGGNASLVQGPGFPNLSTLYYFETPYYESAELEFSNNASLESLGDYPRLESITMITLDNQPALTSLALPSLNSLAWLRVMHNENLTRVDLNIQAKLSAVEVVDNAKLERLNLGTATGVLRRLALEYNPVLATEDRQRLLDRVDSLTDVSLE